MSSFFSISFAANDDYLSELEGEADSTKVEKAKSSQLAKTSSQPSTATTNTDSYLTGLSAEADDTKVDASSAISTQALKESVQTKNNKEEHWSIQSQNLGSLRPSLKWKEFESILKDSYFASYIFYTKLDPTSKNLVYKDYKIKPDIKHIRAKIISLSRK